jgi:hypothetical protein
MNKNIKYAIYIGIMMITAFFAYAVGKENGTMEGYEMAEKNACQQLTSRILTEEGFTGMDVWSEVNAYRRSQKLTELKLSDELCNNIAGRFNEIEKNYSHDGFAEFVDRQIQNGAWSAKGEDVYELLAKAISAEEVVEGWANSPSHSLYLNKRYISEGCVHSWGGTTIMLLK